MAETWTVRALISHTYKGVQYNETDIYTVTEESASDLEVQVNNLEALRMAHRINPADNEDPGV